MKLAALFLLALPLWPQAAPAPPPASAQVTVTATAAAPDVVKAFLERSIAGAAGKVWSNSCTTWTKNTLVRQN